MSSRLLLLLLLRTVVGCAARRGLAQVPELASGAAASGPAASGGHADEAALLLAFKATFNNGVLKDWLPGNDNCAWTGISCNASGNVENIALIDDGLIGTIPWPNGWILPSGVTELSLGNEGQPYRNQIHGPVPPGWRLPPVLSTLHLGNIPLGGSLSAEWTANLPSSLLYLIMDGANLTGSLPSLWNLPAVQTVRLLGNQLTGTIPQYLAELDSLMSMNLSDNRLTGSIPSFRFNASLQAYGLDVSGNNMSGQVPSWPSYPLAYLFIYPGNEGLCGECGKVPEAPFLYSANQTVFNPSTTIKSLPPCPGPANCSSGSSGGSSESSGGAVAQPPAQGATLYWGDLGFGASASYTSSEPVALLGRLPFVSLAAGRTHACGLLANGSAFCVGENGHGQLGDGSGNERAVEPVPVTGGHTFAAVAAGNQFSCGLLPDSQLLCWGRNDVGQLANGTTADALVPGPSAAGFWLSLSSAGAQHACGINATAVDSLQQPRGAAICWGANQVGQLGIGLQPLEFSSIALPVSSSLEFAQLAAGGSHTCGTTPADNGSATYCWGLNADLQMGNPAVDNLTAVFPVEVSGGRQFVQLTAGAFHTCGLENETLSAYCWGQGTAGATLPSAAGQLGYGAMLSSAVPREVAGGHRWRQLSAGGEHTCGIAIEAVNRTAAYCWGSNRAGQLGVGNATLPNSSVPLLVSGGGNISQVVAGWQTTFGIVGNGSLDLSPLMMGAQVSSGGSGSIAVGAIVGIAAAGVVVVAVLCVLAWRKGWLRRKPVAVHQSTSTKLESAPSFSITTGEELRSDPILSYISTYLASRKPAVTGSGSGGSAVTASASASVTGSGSLPALAEWQVDWRDIRLERQVGRGSYGRVYSGTWNGVPVACKVLINQEKFQEVPEEGMQLPESVRKELQGEAVMLSRLRHPCTVAFYGVCDVPPALITEFCSRGSLYDVLCAAQRDPQRAAELTWQRRLGMALDAAMGLQYLHRRTPPIIHRDIKSPNLLIDANWKTKVADLNLSRILSGDQPEVSSGAGVMNPTWLAPEVLEGGRATAAGDVYSFGIVLYELLTWRLPWTFAEMTPFKLVATIRQGGRPEVPPREALPGPDTAAWAGLDTYVQLMRECWAQQPQDRPSCDEVVRRLRDLLEQAESAGPAAQLAS